MVPLGIGKQEPIGPNPLLAIGLSILVGLAVFWVFWKVRKTFGMRS